MIADLLKRKTHACKNAYISEIYEKQSNVK